jgi:SAM-dependent methyltransferase
MTTPLTETAQESPSSTPYDGEFFNYVSATARSSAEVVVPIVMDLLAPRSVADIGCGTGTWLRAFKDKGVVEVCGFDGDYVPRAALEIEQHEFTPVDLTKFTALPHRVDLAVCLEVLEHLPSRAANRIVEVITNGSKACLFSAAIPGQGGTHHINERWHEYWHARFAHFGWKMCDVIRPQIVCNRAVASWYRQNIFLYLGPELASDQSPSLAGLRAEKPLDLEPVYPHILRQMQSVRGTFRLFLRALDRRLRG